LFGDKKKRHTIVAGMGKKNGYPFWKKKNPRNPVSRKIKKKIRAGELTGREPPTLTACINPFFLKQNWSLVLKKKPYTKKACEKRGRVGGSKGTSTSHRQEGPENPSTRVIKKRVNLKTANNLARKDRWEPQLPEKSLFLVRVSMSVGGRWGSGGGDKGAWGEEAEKKFV